MSPQCLIKIILDSFSILDTWKSKDNRQSCPPFSPIEINKEPTESKGKDILHFPNDKFESFVDYQLLLSLNNTIELFWSRANPISRALRQPFAQFLTQFYFTPRTRAARGTESTSRRALHHCRSKQHEGYTKKNTLCLLASGPAGGKTRST